AADAVDEPGAVRAVIEGAHVAELRLAEVRPENLERQVGAHDREIEAAEYLEAETPVVRHGERGAAGVRREPGHTGAAADEHVRPRRQREAGAREHRERRRAAPEPPRDEAREQQQPPRSRGTAAPADDDLASRGADAA